ncbi:hypothetical protein CYMTET_48156 [Cymbomonas tetramitiformis]|uniref:Uncharacterized protein n=1 Tax=Cymbomonas tetramitiformis TaxID=36881 RepID=A0AAE0EVA3_9CHLO|nr:hypothetical protein CYMTET_48156 [Cymbomonas tetramitiformis]
MDSAERNVSYDFFMRHRCRLASDQYTDGLITEGYGRQTECSLIAITDISDNALRQAATFIISDEARTMRLPVRVIARVVNSSSSDEQLAYERSMLSDTVDLLSQGATWTSRVAEQRFDASVSRSVTPKWDDFQSIGGYGAGMHQPLCSCDPYEYVAPTPVREIKHCAPRQFEDIPPPPQSPDSPSSPPPPGPPAPIVNNLTVCRNPSGHIMEGYQMRYHMRDIFPRDCVCSESGMSPVASYSSNTEDTYYCPEECQDSSTSSGPTCICRRQSIEHLEQEANDRFIKRTQLNTVKQAFMDALNDLSVDTVRRDSSKNDTAQEVELAYSFDFELEGSRFPTIEEAFEPSFCENRLGEGWRLHVEQTDDRSTLTRAQEVVDERVNRWTMAATGMAFMDGHPLCLDRYRVSLPPRGRVRYTGSSDVVSESDAWRSVIGPSRTAWRITMPRNRNDENHYSQDDIEYINAALSNSLYSGSSSNPKTPYECRVNDPYLNNIRNTVIMSIFEKNEATNDYRLNFRVDETCSESAEYMIYDSGSTYDIKCTDRDNDLPSYTANDALNRRFSGSNLDHVYTYQHKQDSAYGFMHHIEGNLQRVQLYNQTGYVSSTDRCVLPPVYSQYSDVFVSSDENAHICKMYVDSSFLSEGFDVSDHPKRRYANDVDAVARRYDTINGYSACSNSSQSAAQLLCHDANMLTPEQMGQAATFCGFSLVEESVRPVHTRTACRSIPYGFVHHWKEGVNASKVLYPLVAPSDPVDSIDGNDIKNKMLVLNRTIVDNVESNQSRVVAICERPVPRNLTRDIIENADGDITASADGQSELRDTLLRRARESAAELRNMTAKCVLNALDTFPFLDAEDSPQFAVLHNQSRVNAFERMMPWQLDKSGSTPWPYPWTRRRSRDLLNRVTIGSVMGSSSDGRRYMQLSSIGPVSEKLEIVGKHTNLSMEMPVRLKHAARGSAQRARPPINTTALVNLEQALPGLDTHRRFMRSTKVFYLQEASGALEETPAEAAEKGIVGFTAGTRGTFSLRTPLWICVNDITFQRLSIEASKTRHWTNYRIIL